MMRSWFSRLSAQRLPIFLSHEENWNMSRSSCIHNAAGVGLAVFALALPASAGVLPADALPIPNRVTNAEIIVVGKVTGFEARPVMAAPFAGAKTRTEFKIAVVEISDPLLAPKKLMKVRLGFVPTPFGVRISPPPFQPKVGMEGCFFLTKHGEADFQTVSGALNFLDKNSANYAKNIAMIRRCVKILQDPDAALKSTKGENRFLAAGMLLARYRTRKSPNPKTELIDAEQSKLILQALASADWTPSTDLMTLSPLLVLHRLPLTAKDGWNPPPARDQKAYARYAQQWARDHVGSYRIERFVVEKNK
jgi:hypothetical protein